MKTHGNKCHRDPVDPPGFWEEVSKLPHLLWDQLERGCQALVLPIDSRPQWSWLPGYEDMCLESCPQAALTQSRGLQAHVLHACPMSLPSLPGPIVLATHEQPRPKKGVHI